MISLIRAAWQEELRVPMFVGLSTDGYPASDDPAMKNGARIYYIDTGKEYEYDEENNAWHLVVNEASKAQAVLDEIRILADTIVGSVGIDDDSTTSATTWSSTKINGLLEAIKLTVIDDGNGNIIINTNT